MTNKPIQNLGKLKTCLELLEEYRGRTEKAISKGELLSFSVEKDDKEMTVYNITKPIIKNGKRYLLGRVEPIDCEYSSVMFFVEENGEWKILDHPVFDLQDPFYVENVQGWQVLGGVQVFCEDNNLNYRTVFYKYRNCATELVKNGKLSEPFASGPMRMKDIRLVELKDGKIGLFTRPQGSEAGLGKIAYITINSLDELEQKILDAKIIENQFSEQEWGGANELHLLDNGNIGIVGHIAHFEEGVRHYYSMYFVFDPINEQATPIEIISTADEFPCVTPKRSELGKILFSGGLERLQDGKAVLYAGIGDTQAGFVHITDPFLKYEQQ